MSRKNPLSAFTFPYSKRYYLTHPWKWIHDLYWGIRNFWHRGRWGYAYVDVWNFCDWYPRVGAAALRYLSEHCCGYPGEGTEWDTPERWAEFLKYFAESLDKCADTNDICYIDDHNEYAERFHELAHQLWENGVNDAGQHYSRIAETPEYKELRDRYFARYKELDEEYNEFRINCYKEVGRLLPRLWD